MSNLIPIHINKQTGELVASKQLVGVTSSVDGYLHTQSTPISSWAINHQNGSSFLICQIYTTSGELLLPDSVTIVDGNNILVVFASPQAGVAHVVFFNPI